MISRRAHTWCARRGGGILFEVVLALALFGGAAAFTLGAVRSVFDSFDHMRRRQEAVDLARSKIAQLEAGLVTLGELRSGVGEPTGGASKHGWMFDLKVHRTAYTGLTLIELTVFEQSGAPSNSEGNPISFTLRQLVSLREGDAPEYEQDELARADGGGRR